MNLLIQFLTYFRMIAGPIIFLLILYFDQYGLALVLFFLASISDFFDGFLARRYNLTSELGEIIDPIADKVLLVFLLISIFIVTQSSLVAFMGCILIAREFWVSALRDFNSRNMNTAATKVTFLAKLKTSSQFLTIFLFLFSFYTGSALIEFTANLGLFVSLVLSIQSAVRYSLDTFNK
ncbi:CDP-diacylglycerol--glycerol-3-phosphate 3-phosphatidyltransferase [Gammaproteobacteria bacterium]|nr:CDP-diacylglycerol--glycerol-3-phosphate 3-phosphatidyltransferase [Gammaproteobacteria bacterium]MDB9842352.1 CDP-diacylglycerol--glycerol-3-phosphate 3-phosphatidyltransferase [Gammaproteobacteria bacterium]